MPIIMTMRVGLVVLTSTSVLFFSIRCTAGHTEEEYAIDCGSSGSPCQIEGLADQMRTYSNDSFVISFATTTECCGVTHCDILLRIHDGQGWKKYKDHSYDCSYNDNFWNCSMSISGVETNASFCVIIAPEVGMHFSKPFDVAVQGLPDVVRDISSTVTCNSTCIYWVEPVSLLPVGEYLVIANGKTDFTSETHICYSQDMIEPNTNTTISIVAINKVGPGEAAETYVLSSLEPKGNVTQSFLTYGNESYDVLSVVIAPMVPSCAPSFPLGVQIVCTNCGITCTNSLADEQKYTPLSVNCSLPSFEQIQTSIILKNLEGSDTLPMNFSTNLAQSFEAHALSGSISYLCEFVRDAPIDECYVELKNLDSGEIMFSEAKNDEDDGIAYNTTENLCNGNYTATCYYMTYNTASKEECAFESVTVVITDSNKTCYSSSVPMPTHSSGPSHTSTTSYAPTATPTPSPSASTVPVYVWIIIGVVIGIFLTALVVICVGIIRFPLSKQKEKNAENKDSPNGGLNGNGQRSYGSTGSSDSTQQGQGQQ